jgi:OmpA-OmpF porin, OOP family
MSNLLDSIKGYITPELIGQAASHLGESESGVMKAATGLVPTILSGIMGKSGDANAMGTIFNMLSDNKNAGFLDNLGGLIGGGNLAHNDPKDISGRLMGSLFGGKTQAIINALSSFAGIKSSSTSSLMGMVGPLVMGFMSKKIAKEGLNVSGLTNLLKGEQSSIMSALPSGLGSVMGLADLNTGGHKFETPEAPKVEGGMNWMWPLLLILGLGAGILAYMKGCSKPAMPEVPKIEMPKVEIPKVEVPAAITNFMKKLSSGIEIKGALNGIESQLIGFVEDATKPIDKTTWFNFDHLNFKTASAELDMDFSKDQLTNIFNIMAAYPKLKLKIGGYTDSDGDDKANMALSQKRADAVKSALVAMGADKTRLEAEGYGEQHPVAANDTPENKSQNRRTAVRVMAK